MATTTELDTREVLAGRLVDGLTQAMEMFGVYLGVELGLYRALDELGSATEGELAGHAGVAVRYAREWLEQQAVAGYLACDDPGQPAERRRFRLPEGHAEVLVDADSPFHAAPLALALAGTAGVLPRLLEAYRDGGGVAYADFGRGIRDGIAAANRPMFLHELASAWLPAVPDLHRRLRSAPPPRVLDLGCGLGRRRWPWPEPTRGPRCSGSTSTSRRSTPPARRRPRPAWPTGSRSWSATPPTSPPRPRSTW
jgi:hypothetical protein